MREHPIFKLLSDEEYKFAIDYFEEESIKKGEFILKEGEYSSMAFLLKEGKVAIIKETIYRDDYVITYIEPGDEFFGEVNLIDRGLVTSTIKAAEDCVILKIGHDDFVRILDEHPEIAAKMLWVISYDLTKHLRKADNDVITLFNALVEVVEND